MANEIKQYNEQAKVQVRTEAHRLIDADTGQELQAIEIDKKYYGKHFWKLFLTDFLVALGVIESKQLDAFIFIMENVNPGTNLFIGTYEDISKQTHVSKPTIATLMKKLVRANFLKKVQNGVYQINPEMLMQGDSQKQNILIRYNAELDEKKPLKHAVTDRIQQNRAQETTDANVEGQLQIIGKNDDNTPIIGERAK